MVKEKKTESGSNTQKREKRVYTLSPLLFKVLFAALPAFFAAPFPVDLVGERAMAD